MIGIFDSGSGGLTFLAAARRVMPEYSYVYFGDYAHCPYGDRTPDEILDLTTQGVQRLFDAGAQIVILACNTASAWSLRRLQTEIFPDKKILGVTIPGAERALELGLEKVTVFATEQTVKSRTYKERMHILDSEIAVTEIALPGQLVRDIEGLLPVQNCHSIEDYLKLELLYHDSEWQCDSDAWRRLVENYFDLPRSIESKTGIILGCTHYSYLRKILERVCPNNPIIDPSEEAARKLVQYIHSHQLQSRLSQQGIVTIL